MYKLLYCYFNTDYCKFMQSYIFFSNNLNCVLGLLLYNHSTIVHLHIV